VLFFLLLTCTAELLTILLSVALYGESPLEPIQLLWINLVTGSLVAVPLGLEPRSGTELSQPPRDPSVGLLYPGTVLRIALTGLFMCVPVTWVFHHAPLPPAVDTASAHSIRQTVAFTGIVIFEWLFAFQARSSEQQVWRLGLLRNRWLSLSMVLGLGLQLLVIYIPPVSSFFHTGRLTLVEWAWTLLPGIAAVVLEMLRKRLAPKLFSAGQWQPLRAPRRLPLNG